MIKNNKIKTIISSLITLLPALFGIIVYDKLPEQLATHWGANGEADGWSSTAIAVFALPLILLAFHIFALVITSFDNRNREQNKKAIGIVFWIVPFISILSNSIMYATAFGMTVGIEKILPIILGLMFIFIGNYMPKCRQNLTLGIKIKPTLESEANWNATHRVAGKVWFFGGLVMLFFVLLPTEIMFAATFISIVPMIVIPTIYSYSYRKKEIDEGTEMKSVHMGKNAKKGAIVGIVLALIICVFAAVVTLTGKITAELSDTSFKVKATYYSSLTVEYSDITDIQLRDGFDFGRRIHGFGSARLLIGSFKNGEFGTYTLYAFARADSAVVVKTREKVLVIALESKEATENFYKDLLLKTIGEE